MLQDNTNIHEEEMRQMLEMRAIQENQLNENAQMREKSCVQIANLTQQLE